MKRRLLALCAAALVLPVLALAQEPLPAVPLSRSAAAERAIQVSPELQQRAAAESQAALGAHVPRLFHPALRLEVEGEKAGLGGREYSRRLSLEQAAL